MYCSNCGKKVDEKAVICVNCGCELKKRSGQNGKGIASMVLGIIALFYALCAFINIVDLGSYLDSSYSSMSYQIGFAIGYVLVQSVLSIIGFVLALIERKTKKNGFNTAGFWLSIVTFVIVAIQFIIVVTYQKYHIVKIEQEKGI